MSNNGGDWRSAAFRKKVIFNIDEALKKSTNPKERNALEIESHIFDKATSRESYMTIVARIILALSGTSKGQVPTQVTNSGSILDPNLQASNMMNPVDALKNDNNSLPKILAQPLKNMSTPSPKMSPSPSAGQQGKQTKTSQGKTPQVNSNANHVYPSPSSIVPSPSPAGHSPAPVGSPQLAQSPASVLAVKGTVGIPSVESPGSFNPPSNPGSAESPVKLSDKEEQLYVEKLKQLSVYTEPLRKMIAKMQNDEDAANKDSKNLTKLKRLLSILGNSKERVPYQALLKVETVLVRRLGLNLNKPKLIILFYGYNRSQKLSKALRDDPPQLLMAAPIGHSLLEALSVKAEFPQSNNSLFRMFGPTLSTIHGPPICPPPIPSPRREHEQSDSDLPNVVKTEIAQLAEKFSVDFSNDGDEGREKMMLVCSINDKTLPAVPSLLISIPQNYPHSSPQCNAKDYDATEFLKKIINRLKDKLLSFPRMYTFTTLLLNWEACVRYVSARKEEKAMDS